MLAERKPTSLKSSDSSRIPTGTRTASTMESGAGRITQILTRGLPRAMTGTPVMWPTKRSWRRWRRPFDGWATSLNSGDQNELIRRQFQRANGAEQDVLFCMTRLVWTPTVPAGRVHRWGWLATDPWRGPPHDS